MGDHGRSMGGHVRSVGVMGGQWVVLGGQWEVKGGSPGGYKMLIANAIAEQRLYPSFFGSDIWVKSESNLIYLSKIWVKRDQKSAYSRHIPFRDKLAYLVRSRLRAMIQSKTFNMVESACLQCESWSFYFRNSPGLLDSPFFIQIDTFGKWLRCLTMSVM